MKKRPFQFQYFPFSILIFIAIYAFFMTIPCLLSADQNKVHLGLCGAIDTYGVFHSMRIWNREEIRDENQIQVIYAACATSKGILIYDLYDQSVASFIPLGICYDVKIETSDQGRSCNIFAAGSKAGLTGS